MRRSPRCGLVAVLACAPLAMPVDAAPARSAGLHAFSSCQSLLAYAQHHARRAAPRYRRWESTDRVPATGAPGVMPMSGSSPAAGGGVADESGGSSTTNVQEAGVDEPDIVKTHGSVVLAVADDKLYAVDAGSPRPRRRGSLAVEGYDAELLVHGDRALVITSTYAEESDREATLLSEVDVSDPGAMRVLRTQRVDGYVVSARLAGSSARVVVSSAPRALEAGDVGMRRQLRGWMPTTDIRDRRTGERIRRPVTRCRSVSRPARFSGLEMTTVLTIDLDRGLPAIDSDAVLSDADTVYASRDNLYVATQRWSDEGFAGPTAIHKFDVSGPDTTYRASGEVAGSVPSQWALSEHGGILRVASIAEDPDDGEQTESYATTLGERDGRLVRVGHVAGLGKGEDLYAVRFIGDVGYVVTFRQTDPLYTIDLSDPARPRVAGELKITGYSAYLHPIGDDLLLGVGQDATARGATLGTQLSVFDVSDPAHPRRLHKRRLPFGDSWSEAEDDHHAFLYWGPKDLAVLPIEGSSFSGAVGYRVRGDDVIQETGRTREDWVRRSLVVDGRLVTVSDEGLAIHDLDTLARRGALRF